MSRACFWSPAQSITTMGQSISNMFASLWRGKKELRCAMIGLDAAGKTTLIQKMLPGNETVTVQTEPTIGFNLEKVQYKHIEMTVWDIGGSEKIRPLWKCYYYTTHAVIYVVDASDRERFPLSRDLLHGLVDCMLPAAVLLVFANKQDRPGAASGAEVAEALDLHGLPAARSWHVQAASAVKGDGLAAGLEWLGERLDAATFETP